MKTRLCFCRFILAVLVIVLAWWDPTWQNIALTVIGALLAILALTGVCCCRPKCEETAEPAEPAEPKEE